MNTSTYKPLDVIVDELIHHGLPADYARRAAAELTDHHHDLVEELQAAGWTDSYAVMEASRRLGDPRAFVRKTVREYQRRYWCGRWPLITFFLGPIPTLLMLWLVAGLMLAGIGWAAGLVMDESTTTAIESVGPYAVAYALKIWLMLASPVMVVVAFCWLAARAALSRAWFFVASGMTAMFISFAFCKIEFKTATNPTGSLMIGYNPWFLPENFNSHLFNFFTRDMWQIGQLVLPIVAMALSLLYFRARLGADSRLQSPLS